MTTVLNLGNNVLPPADDASVDQWRAIDEGRVRRVFVGTMRGDGPHVNILGRQYADGTVERFIQSDAGYLGHRFDAAGAREHARQLMAAADEWDGLR